MVSVIFGLRVLSIVCMILGGLLSYGFILHKIGFILGIVAMMFLPITAVVAPWYEGFVLSNWLPFILVYGGTVAAFIFGSMESKLR